MCTSELYMEFCRLISPFSLQYVIQTRIARIRTHRRNDVKSLVMGSARVYSIRFLVIFR